MKYVSFIHLISPIQDYIQNRIPRVGIVGKPTFPSKQAWNTAAIFNDFDVDVMSRFRHDVCGEIVEAPRRRSKLPVLLAVTVADVGLN